MDDSCFTWYNPQWSHPYLCVCNFKKKGKRFRIYSSDSTIITDFFSEALAESVVKIAGRDVLATWKILIAMGAAPVLYSFYAIIATIIAIRANAPLKWKILTPFLVVISLPFMNYAALKFGEAGMDVLKFVILSYTRYICG